MHVSGWSEAAISAAKKRGSYLEDKFFRLKAKRGYKRAAMAIAHKILKMAHRTPSTREEYKDLGDAYLDHLDERRVASKRLGYQVEILPREAPAPA